ncbi:MAG: adenylate kinase [Anaerolineae bacterium]|nr:adenylate kinase [Anaerolineae bacterium]
MQRVHVVGTSGSGKTTSAQRLAARLEVPHVELDALYWGPGWAGSPPEVFRWRVSEALSGEAWVVDGNYSRVRDIIWERADTVVWLDFPLAVIMARLLWRTLSRIVTREELWHGNRESARMTFFSRDSILLWALTTYRRRRREYPALFAQPEHAHLRIIHLRSPRATRAWLAAISP